MSLATGTGGERVPPLGLPRADQRFRRVGLAAFVQRMLDLGALLACPFALGYGRHEPRPRRVLRFVPALLGAMRLAVLADGGYAFANMRAAERAPWLATLAAGAVLVGTGSRAAPVPLHAWLSLKLAAGLAAAARRCGNPTATSCACSARTRGSPTARRGCSAPCPTRSSL